MNSSTSSKTLPGREWATETGSANDPGSVAAARRAVRGAAAAGPDLTRSFRDLADAAVQQLPEEAVRDGEAVVGVDGRLDFAELQKRVAAPTRAASRAEWPATFLAFDLLVLAGEDLRDLPLSARRPRLMALMEAWRPPLQQVSFTLDHDEAGRWLRDYATAHIGVEGLVLKRVDDRYVGGVRRSLSVPVMHGPQDRIQRRDVDEDVRRRVHRSRRGHVPLPLVRQVAGATGSLPDSTTQRQPSGSALSRPLTR